MHILEFRDSFIVKQMVIYKALAGTAVMLVPVNECCCLVQGYVSMARPCTKQNSCFIFKK